MNTSRFFHVTEGLVPDIMHDVLEGCLPYEAKELLKYLIQNKVITLTEVNRIIDSFPYSPPDASNKPILIASTTLSSTDHGLKQTGELRLIVTSSDYRFNNHNKGTDHKLCCYVHSHVYVSIMLQQHRCGALDGFCR